MDKYGTNAGSGVIIRGCVVVDLEKLFGDLEKEADALIKVLKEAVDEEDLNELIELLKSVAGEKELDKLLGELKGDLGCSV